MSKNLISWIMTESYTRGELEHKMEEFRAESERLGRLDELKNIDADFRNEQIFSSASGYRAAIESRIESLEAPKEVREA